MKNFVDCIKKRVCVELSCESYSAEGEEENRLNLTTEGVLSMGLEEAELRFREVLPDGSVGMRYDFRIRPHELEIRRRTEFENVLVLRAGRSDFGCFHTEFGDLKIHVITHEQKIHLTAKEGCVECRYFIAFPPDHHYNENRLYLRYREAEPIKV